MKEARRLKLLRQFTLILLIALTGEALNALLPLPIPASIYGVVLLFALLCTGAIPLSSVKDVSALLIEIMPVLFIPAAVGLTESFGLLLPSLWAYLVILVASTFAVMAVSGRVAQAALRRSKKEEGRHA